MTEENVKLPIADGARCARALQLWKNIVHKHIARFNEPAYLSPSICSLRLLERLWMFCLIPGSAIASQSSCSRFVDTT